MTVAEVAELFSDFGRKLDFTLVFQVKGSYGCPKQTALYNLNYQIFIVEKSFRNPFK